VRISPGSIRMAEIGRRIVACAWVPQHDVVHHQFVGPPFAFSRIRLKTPGFITWPLAKFIPTVRR